MGYIKRKLIEFLLRDFYALKDLDHPQFGQALAAMKQKKKLTSAPPSKYSHNTDISTYSEDGFVYYTMQSRKKTSDKTVIYIHGGGFVAEAFAAHWDFCKRLTEKTGCRIIFPQYPLVPESNTFECHDMLLRFYRKVLGTADPSDITMIGDSAGGALCLSLSMLARDSGLPLPKSLILISPGLGLHDLNDEEKARFEEIKKHDFMIGQFPVRKIAELWHGGKGPVDYRTAVTMGSLENLPEITMFSGTYDILNVPARKLAARLKDEGRPYLYIEKKGGYHVYALSRKAREEFDLIASKIIS